MKTIENRIQENEKKGEVKFSRLADDSIKNFWKRMDNPYKDCIDNFQEGRLFHDQDGSLNALIASKIRALSGLVFSIAASLSVEAAQNALGVNCPYEASAGKLLAFICTLPLNFHMSDVMDAALQKFGIHPGFPHPPVTKKNPETNPSKNNRKL